MFKEIFRENSLQNYGVNLLQIRKIIFINIFLILFSTAGLYAQNYDIDYYGVVSKEIDTNMAKMTSDLYYTQLTEINNFNITDKRTDFLSSAAPDNSTFSDNKLSFFTTIEKDKNSDSWITTYHVIDKFNNEEHTKQKKYDSFYKILMESKNILKETIKNLIENDVSPDPLQKPSVKNDSFPGESVQLTSTESLSGTWTGEENINKIVILRGGRGFVIFKNGASMNVTVTLSEENPSDIIILQNGRANASFYPELPRNMALKAALDASPIRWILKLTDSNTLTGNKETLLPETDGDSYKIGLLKVKWEKIN